MNMSKTFNVLIVLLLLSLSLSGCDIVQITLPNEDDLERIVLLEPTEENNTYITITDNEEVRNIIDNIKSNSKHTSKQSVSDTPTNVDYYIKLEFSNSKDENIVAYVYRTEDRYYIEQPYIGIWEITQESYDNIYTLLKANIVNQK